MKLFSIFIVLAVNFAISLFFIDLSPTYYVVSGFLLFISFVCWFISSTISEALKCKKDCSFCEHSKFWIFDD